MKTYIGALRGHKWRPEPATWGLERWEWEEEEETQKTASITLYLVLFGCGHEEQRNLFIY